MHSRMIAIAALLLLASSCTTRSVTPANQSRMAAPDSSLPTLDGQHVAISTLRGKVVVLDFWATWCPPCREALPHLASLAANSELAQRGLVVVAVNEREKPATIRAFLEQTHYVFTIAQDADGSTGQAYGVSALPTTIIIGREGIVEAVISGWTPQTPRQIDEAIMRALGTPPR